MLCYKEPPGLSAITDDILQLVNLLVTVGWTHAAIERTGIGLTRDSLVSVMYAEELHSGKSSATHQRTDRHEILSSGIAQCLMMGIHLWLVSMVKTNLSMLYCDGPVFYNSVASVSAHRDPRRPRL